MTLNTDSNIEIDKKGFNTSLAAQGALAHRLQHSPRPIHDNAKSGAKCGWDMPKSFGHISAIYSRILIGNKREKIGLLK